MTGGLVERLLERHARNEAVDKIIDPVAFFQGTADLKAAADAIVQAREALERIANVRTETKGGSIVECRHIARQALSALDRKG